MKLIVDSMFLAAQSLQGLGYVRPSVTVTVCLHKGQWAVELCSPVFGNVGGETELVYWL